MELQASPVSFACLLQWATLRIERGAKEKNHPLYKPYANGRVLPCVVHTQFRTLSGRWGEHGLVQAAEACWQSSSMGMDWRELWRAALHEESTQEVLPSSQLSRLACACLA